MRYRGYKTTRHWGHHNKEQYFTQNFRSCQAPKLICQVRFLCNLMFIIPSILALWRIAHMPKRVSACFDFGYDEVHDQAE